MKTGLPTPDSVPANLSQIMKQNNYSNDTIERYTKVLDTLTKRGANLTDVNSVKDTIAKQQWDNGTKQTARNAILLFYKYAHINETLPRYKRTEKMVFIPTENEIDQLISGTKHLLATFLQTLKETASRYGEALQLTWTDFNTEANTLSINHPEKGSNPRTIKISIKLATMISALPHNTNKIFPYKDKNILRKGFYRARKRIANNTGNPRLLQIHFHTLRHWKATAELHKTNNVYAVMKLLGHKSLSNTQRYIGLLPDLTDDFVCETTDTIEKAVRLIQNGYEYVTEMNGTKIFKKRK
jgi:integrase